MGAAMANWRIKVSAKARALEWMTVLETRGWSARGARLPKPGKLKNVLSVGSLLLPHSAARGLSSFGAVCSVFSTLSLFSIFISICFNDLSQYWLSIVNLQDGPLLTIYNTSAARLSCRLCALHWVGCILLVHFQLILNTHTARQAPLSRLRRGQERRRRITWLESGLMQMRQDIYSGALSATNQSHAVPSALPGTRGLALCSALLCLSLFLESSCRTRSHLVNRTTADDASHRGRTDRSGAIAEYDSGIFVVPLSRPLRRTSVE